MAGSLLPTVVWRALDSAGKPISGAKLYVYLTGTTTKTPSYTTSNLAGAQNTNPVIADSAGLFPAIFLDPAVTYRLRLTNASDAVLAPDVDPFSVAPNLPDASVTSAKLAVGAAAANLGFTPLDAAGDSATGELILDYTLGPAPDANSAGFRGAPLIGGAYLNGNHHFVADDAGKTGSHTDASAYAWTIDPDATVNFPFYTVIPFRNTGAGVITLTRGAGVTLRIAGSATNQNIAVAQWGFGSLVKDGTNTWFAAGTGLS